MIHRFSQNNYNMVLDVYSGAVHVMDKLAYDLAGLLTPPLTADCPQTLTEQLAAYPQDAVQAAYKELYSLYQQGQLFAADDYAKYAENSVESPLKAMCLHIAHDCNLRCAYCFADTGEYMGHRELMTSETGRKAIDYLLAHSKGRRFLEVDFFGGEPLMNLQTVKDITAYARSKQKEYDKVFRFTITTNGVLLNDDAIGFINEEMSNVVLSLDGRQTVNDRVRRRVDGSGCFDTIVPRFQKLVQGRTKPDRTEYYVRGTFTSYNLDFTQDVLALYELGFDQISVEPVVASPDKDYALTEKHLPAVFAEYEKLALEMANRQGTAADFNFFHFMVDLEQGPCAIKRLRGCGSGNEYAAITPAGDVYPCHQFVGHPDWRMGSVWDGTLDKTLKKQFAGATVYSKSDCVDCWAKFYCSGGCNANNMVYQGSILKAHSLSCEMEKKRLECALMLQAAKADKEAG